MKPFLYVYGVRMITFNVFLGYIDCLNSSKYVTVFGLVAPVQR